MCEKHAHGIFNNIFLTEDEYKDYRLRVRDIDTIIDELSEAVAAEPKKYAKKRQRATTKYTHICPPGAVLWVMLTRMQTISKRLTLMT